MRFTLGTASSPPLLVDARKTLSDLVKKTSFTLIELGRLLENFVDASDATGRLDRPTFHTVLMKHAPGLTEDGIINRVHEVLDTDADGFINYKELCLGTAKATLWVTACQAT